MGNRAKEAIVCLVDVSTSMGERLLSDEKETRVGIAKKFLKAFLTQKLVFSKRDEVGIVLFGSDETDNQLNLEVGEDEYQNVVVKNDVEPSSLETIRGLEEIESSKQTGDVLDGIIVALDLLHRKVGKKKYTKHLFLITDGASPLAGMDEADAVLGNIVDSGTEFNLIGIDFAEKVLEDGSIEVEDDLAIKRENEELLRTMVQQGNGNFLRIDEALALATAQRRRTIMQVTKFRGNLEISGQCGIPVYVYAKTKEEYLPSLKKESTLSEGAGVKMDRIYKNPDNPLEVLGPEDKAKGFKFGKQLVPFSASDEATSKYQTERCLQLLGFVNRSQVPRHHFISGADMVVPEIGNTAAASALSALVQALKLDESLGVARFVPRANADVRIVALSPLLAPACPEGVDCLLLNQLPLLEDIRGYKFPSFEGHKLQPDAGQVHAMESLVESMSYLPPPAKREKKGHDDKGLESDREGGGDLFSPCEHLYNPVISRFNQLLVERALDPKAALPPAQDILGRYDLQKKLEKGLVNKIEALFPLSIVDRKKEKKRFWSEREEGKEEKEDERNSSDEELDVRALLKDSSVTSVGSMNPVRDFETMVQRPELREKAIYEMGEMARNLIQIAPEYFPKAIHCLRSLRKHCLETKLSSTYNDYLHELRTSFASRQFSELWSKVGDEKLSLITKGEDSDVDVSEAQAKALLAQQEAPAPEAVQEAAPVIVEDEMFEDME